MPNLNSLSPFAFKVLLIVAAVVLSHYGMLTDQLGQMFLLAVGGGAVTAAVQAWQSAKVAISAMPYPPSQAQVHSALASLVQKGEAWVEAQKAQTEAVTKSMTSGGEAVVPGGH